MNILFVTGIYPPESGGPSWYVHGMARALRERGHLPTIVTYADRSETVQEDGITIHRVARSGGPVVRYLRMAWRTWWVGKKADVLFAQDSVSSGVPASVANIILQKPLVMRIPGDYAWEMAQQQGERALLDAFLERRHRGRIRVLEWLERWTAKRANHLIVPSRYLGSVVKRWKVQVARIHAVINAANPLPSARSYAEERQAFSVSSEARVVFTVARAVPWKGIAELIAWWSRLPKTHMLVVAGDGPELEHWRALTESSEAKDRIRILGRADRQTIARWFAAADAFVLHSGYEGYPFVVAEAASTGLPCFVSDQGGNPETKEDFPGLVTVIPYQDEEASVKALSEIGKRPAQAVVVTRSYEAMTEETEQVLKEACGQSTDIRYPHSVLMVSYDRALMDPMSEVFTRVASLAPVGGSMEALVIAQSKETRTVSHGLLTTHAWSGRSFARLWSAFWRGVKTIRRAKGAWIVTAQDPFAAGWLAYFISRVTNRPLEIQEHGDFFSGAWKREKWSHRVWTWFAPFLLRRAEHVRVVSERVRDHVIALGVDPRKIDVVPVSMDLAALFARPFKVAGDRFQIVAPCRFVSQKGLDILLQSASLLTQRGALFTLRLIGAGPLERECKTTIDRLGLGDHVTIEGWRASDRLWDDADLFVLSSRYEGWGRTVVEAMAAGVPVVATETGCVGSFFRPTIDGLAVPVGNAQALADAMERMITDRESRERMVVSSRDRAQEFPLPSVLHDRQQAGWSRTMKHVSRQEVGPRWDLWILGFLMVAIGMRGLSTILFHGGLVYREWGFFLLVDHWFKGLGYTYSLEPGCLSANRSPGFLFFLTALYSVFSYTNTWAQAIIQNVIVVGVLWLVYAVGKRLVGKRAALLGGLAMAFYPYTFYHYTQYYHTFLSSFFLLLLVWFLLRVKETGKHVHAIGSGVALAALAYIQGTLLPASPIIVLWLLWCWWPDWKKTFRVAVIMAVVSAALIAPWTYRNWKAFHQFVPLTTDIGFGLWKANNENIYALTKVGYPQEVVDVVEVSSTNPRYVRYQLRPEIAQELDARGEYRPSLYWTEWHPKEPGRTMEQCSDLPLNEYEHNKYWLGKAQTWIKTNWWSEGWKLSLLKIRTFWQPSLFPSVKMGAPWSFAGDPLKEMLARWSVTLSSAFVIFGGWLGIMTWVWRRDRRVWLPIIILGTYTLMHAIFAGYTKYRIPLDNLLAMYAGWILVRLWDGVRKK